MSGGDTSAARGEAPLAKLDERLVAVLAAEHPDERGRGVLQAVRHVLAMALPYGVNFGLEVLEAERPRRILTRLSKDFDGTGEWTLRETAAGTEATLDWRRPSVNHPLIRYLTPVLRPLFRSNHQWAMRRGERQLRDYLASGSNA